MDGKKAGGAEPDEGEPRRGEPKSGSARKRTKHDGPYTPEHRCRAVDQTMGAGHAHTDPGSPWQNGFNESFNGKFRDECLNQEVFFSRIEAQIVVEWWRRSYNEERPHSALGGKTPAEVAAAHRGMYTYPGGENSVHGFN